MRVGFTGTQQGMTDPQKKQVKLLATKLLSLQSTALEDAWFHHGMCIGADEEAHHIFKGEGYAIVGHPCTIHWKQVDLEVDERRTVKEPIPRNHDIVDEVEVMVATPKEQEMIMRSGTWATIRYARKTGRYLYIVYPDGTIGA